MRATWLKLGSPLVALMMLLGLWAQGRLYAAAADATPFHARAREAIESIPDRIGDWYGTKVEVPRSARALLRPNALFSMRYRNARTGQIASLVVVQTEDARDMAGHYPPNCYPGQGWQFSRDPVRRRIDVGSGVELPVIEYTFEMEEFNNSVEIVIYNFFMLPGVGVVPDMADVRRAASDYRMRPFGAAQIQVLVDSSMPPSERDAVFKMFMQPLLPVIGLLQEGPGSSTR